MTEKEKFDMEGRSRSFGVVLLVFGAIFAATHAGADPTSGQCTVS